VCVYVYTPTYGRIEVLNVKVVVKKGKVLLLSRISIKVLKDAQACSKGSILFQTLI
jgi:hypothetical protein